MIILLEISQIPKLIANDLDITTWISPSSSGLKELKILLFPILTVDKLNSNFSGNSFLSRNNSEYFEYNLIDAKHFVPFDSKIRLITVFGWRLNLRHHERGHQTHGFAVLVYSIYDLIFFFFLLEYYRLCLSLFTGM